MLATTLFEGQLVERSDLAGGALALDLPLELIADLIGGLVLTGKAVMEGLEPAPTEGFLNASTRATFQQELLEGFAIEEVLGFQFANG